MKDLFESEERKQIAKGVTREPALCYLVADVVAGATFPEPFHLAVTAGKTMQTQASRVAKGAAELEREAKERVREARKHDATEIQVRQIEEHKIQWRAKLLCEQYDGVDYLLFKRPIESEDNELDGWSRSTRATG